MPQFALALQQTTDLVPGIRVMVALLVGLLIATAIVLRPGRWAASGMLRSQVTSWWLLLPPVFLAWALFPFGVAVLVITMSMLAARELVEHSERLPGVNLWWSFAFMVAVQVILGVMNLRLWSVALMLVVASNRLYGWHASGRTHRNSLLQALFAVQAAGLWCLVALAPTSMPQGLSATWFLYLCVVTALNDIGQFLIGTLFGRHKLATRISPNKTWQGVGGGLVFSIMFSLMVGQALGLASPFWLFCMGIVLSVAGLLGDLMFSAGKRLLGIKDYSGLIPGHGGILDRVDSLVLTAPVMLVALRLA